jgi:O-acetyl-ADP-ribose deacetylase (regulator of RNase III)
MSKIEIKNTSCLDEEVDVVVNAANIYLASGGGVCGAIFAKAGYEELKNACSKIDTPLNDGDAVITPAFNITNAKFIIHAVGPNFGKTPNAFDKLFNAYYNSLKVLKENNLHSIAFPLISSGIFGGSLKNPSLESAKECIKAYNKFIEENKEYEIDVKVCAFTKNEYEQIRLLLE